MFLKMAVSTLNAVALNETRNNTEMTGGGGNYFTDPRATCVSNNHRPFGNFKISTTSSFT
jgi:hypothetical protein